MTLKRWKRPWLTRAAYLSLGLALLLSGCTSRTETVVDIQYILPPAGLIVPCDKPQLTGKTPAETAKEIPYLKSALSECAAHADEYLEWRKQREDGH